MLLKRFFFLKNDLILKKKKKGEIGNKFFFIVKGTAIATKFTNLGKETEKVFEYSENDYFGELALIRDTTRAANIIATVLS